MITAPNKYLGITANKLSCIATELEQKNATLTAENVHLQKELEAEHALAEALGHELEQAKAENAKTLMDMVDTEGYDQMLRDRLRQETELRVKADTENTRLKELVADMLVCVSEGDWDCSDCPRYARCDDGVSEFIDRARELGIEVKK